MKSLALVISLSCAKAAFAIGFDGCYQMYRTNVNYPVVCLQGTSLESLTGEGAHYAIFKTNSETPSQCMTTSGLIVGAHGAEITVLVNGRKEMSLLIKNKNYRNLRIGEVKMPYAFYFFQELDQATTEKHLSNLAKSKLCK